MAPPTISSPGSPPGTSSTRYYTEVTVAIRAGVTWSDGQPWTVHDFAFTINMLKANAPLLLFSTDMETWVKEAVAVDSLTARIDLTAPNPRFIFTYFTHNFDNGVPIVPKHIWEGQDPETFKNLDLAQDWPVVSGPYIWRSRRRSSGCGTGATTGGPARLASEPRPRWSG